MNTTHTVRTVFSATAAGFNAAVASMEATVTHLSRVTTINTQKNTQDWNRMTAGFLTGGVAMAGGLLLTAKAAMDWQTAFTGVKKTVDTTDPAFGQLEGQLRGLARTMATSHEEIAGVAEVAGQLGIKVKDITNFTRTMVQLGETTNLSAEDAGTSLAQFMVIMGSVPESVGKIGATVVDLGNNLATTESQIVQMSQRLAGAGRALGFTEAQVLGFSGAIASTGIEVEAGGSAMSRTLLKLESITSSTGSKIATLNRLTGIDFATAFREDAAGATQIFVESLGKVQKRGGSVTQVLANLGITGIRETDVIRRLASSGDLLSRSLGIANNAMDKGTALLVEYQKRMSTADSQVQVSWNNIKDSAIDAGSQFLPMITDGAKQVAQFAHSVGTLPGPVKAVGSSLTVAAAAGLLMVGGGMKVVGVVSNMITSFKTLSETSPKTAAGIKKAAVAALAFTAAVAALKAFTTSYEEMAASVRTKSSDLSVAMLEGFNSGAQKLDFTKVFGTEEKNAFSHEMFSARDAMQRAFSPDFAAGLADGFWNAFGISTSGSRIKDQVTEVDKALSDLAASGNAAAAAQGYREFEKFVTDSGVSMDVVRPKLEQYRQQLDLIAEGLSLQGQISEQEYVDWMGGKIPVAVQRATASGGSLVDNLTDQQKQLAGVTSDAEAAVKALNDLASASIAAQGGKIGVDQSVSDALDAIGKRGKSTSTTSKTGKANWSDYLASASQVQSYINGLKEAGADESKLASTHDAMVAKLTKVGKAMGMTGEDARALAEYYSAVPGDVQTTFEAHGAEVTKQQAKDIETAVSQIPEAASVNILAPGARPSKKEVSDFISEVDGVPPETKAAIKTIAELGGVDAARTALAKVKDKNVKVNVTWGSTPKTLKIGASGTMRIGFADGGILVQSGRALVDAYANGGMRPPPIGAQQPQIRPYSNPRGILWGEEGSGPWEAWISGHPDKRNRSIAIWEKVGKRLGLLANADGNLVDFNTIRSTASAARWAGASISLTTNTYYPQAEPTSVTNRRAIEAAAAIGKG